MEILSRGIAKLKQNYLTWRMKRKKGDMYILMLHEVTTESENPLYESVSITKSNFEALITSIFENKIEFDSVTNLYKDKGKRVIITFDDIFENAYRNAFPLLNERKIPYTVFITTEYVDKEGFITTEQLNELKENPLCTIGFHANRHLLMRELNNQEIKENVNSQYFEDKFGIKCEYFAFPYGSVYACPKRAIELAKGKYLAVFSTINSTVSAEQLDKSNSFIPRLCVNDKTWNKIF